jgi:spermidine synthase
VAPLYFLCFFLSGACGLVFELVWTRELTLIFGSTTLAISTVLSVFMGGLAFGSWAAGKLVDRLRDPVRAYAAAEAGVGLYGLAVPIILGWYPALNALMWRSVGDHFVAMSLLRFVATAILLLLPTFLMGATLPILSRAIVARPGDFGLLGFRVGSLYAANTFGAVAGTFLAGFVLLPGLGVRTTNAVAACTNLSLTVMLLVARFRMRRKAARGDRPLDEVVELDTNDDDAPGEERPPPPAPATERQRKVALYAFACSGAAAMVYQVLWSRALAIVIGSSVYSFALILLAFLVGLAVGAALMSRIAGKVRRPVLWLASIHFGVVATVMLSYTLIDKLPAAFLTLLRGGSFSVDGILFSQFLLAALAVLPATLVMGGVMPLTVRIYTVAIDSVGRDIGNAYAMNTLGAIAGSFGAGFVVLPVLGLQIGLHAAAVASALVAAALLLVSEIRLSWRIVGALSGVAATVALALFLPRWDLGHFQAGLFRVSLAKEIVESGKWAVPELQYYRDGIATTVSVEKWGKHLALKNNGKVDASNGDDMPTQIMVGLMPLLFHPTALEKPARIAVIGYGSGVTVGASTQFPIGHADVVELEPEIVYASRWFEDVNHQPDKNPKVNILVGDGRNFLTQGDDRYDVIISEPSNPWITGVSNLFTRDYWTLAQRRLTDDGVFCQWAQLYELSPRNIKTILKTFSEVFPYTYIFSAEDLSSDVILVATNHPLRLDRARLAKNFDDPVLKAELKRADVHSAEDLLAYLLLTPDEIPAFTAGAEENTDDNALIEFAAPRDLLGYMRYDPYLARVYGADWPYGRFDDYLTGLGEGPARGESEARIADSLTAHGKRGAASRFIARAKRHEGGAVAERSAKLLELLSTKTTDDTELPLASDADPLDPPTVPKDLSTDKAAEFARDYAQVEDELRRHRFAHALKAMGAWPEKWVDDGGQDLQFLVGYLLYKAEMEDDAVDRLKPLAADPAYVKRRPQVLYYLARSYYGEAFYEAGAREMNRYLDLPPQPPPPPPAPEPEAPQE